MSLSQTSWFKALTDNIIRRPRSVSFVFFNLLILSIVISNTKVYAEEGATPDPTLVEEKYSLRSDLEAFAELRKNVPENKRLENEEKAFMDQLFIDLKKNPSEIREKFSKIVSKKRELFNKDMIKARQKLSAHEREVRAQFEKEQAETRKNFSQKKVSAKERSDFFSDLEAKRKDFVFDLKEKREDFEADVREKRANFNDYIRSRTDEFNDLLKEFRKRQSESASGLTKTKTH